MRPPVGRGAPSCRGIRHIEKRYSARWADQSSKGEKRLFLREAVMMRPTVPLSGNR